MSLNAISKSELCKRCAFAHLFNISCRTPKQVVYGRSLFCVIEYIDIRPIITMRKGGRYMGNHVKNDNSKGMDKNTPVVIVHEIEHTDYATCPNCNQEIDMIEVLDHKEDRGGYRCPLCDQLLSIDWWIS